MQKIAKILVEKRYAIMGVMLILAVVFGILSFSVTINSDLTEYLPDSSPMKTGIDIMEKEFPGLKDSGNIRVMFTGLDDQKKTEVLEKLKAIRYVDSVKHEPGSADYNNGSQSLFIVNFKYGYDTSEAAAIEKAISAGFREYDMVYHVDNDSYNLPVYIVILAMVILMAILFVMSASWLEPFLFLAAIGVSILLNMGTNILLGSVSQITSSIAAVLQLVLSMDYAIMLINRYRQELLVDGDPKTAMKRALVNAFSSITSSSVTTIVGLLVLCFMSFKIGMDLGIVLAKGVLFSLLCIFTILPALILACDKLIKKTAKKVLHIKMDALGRLNDKFRFVSTGAFVVIFVGALLLSHGTKLAYILEGEDRTEKYFPKDSTVVVLYQNSDKAAAAELADQYAANPAVKSVQSYSTTLGKKYTAGELSTKLTDAGKDSGLSIDPALLNILYYDYFNRNAQGAMTVGSFIDFVANSVVTNPSFAPQLGGDIKDKLDAMKKLADHTKLTRPMNAQEIADFLGLKQDDITQVFMVYYMKNGGVETGVLTLPQFSDFVVTEIAANIEYASMLDKETLSLMNQLKVFTNRATVTEPLSAARLAASLGMDESAVRLLLVYYYASLDSFDAGTLTVSQFVDFLTSDVASNTMFASYLDSAALAQMSALSTYTNSADIQKQMTGAELAAALGMDSAMVEQLFQMASAAKGTPVVSMSMQEFVNFVCSNVITNPQMASRFDQTTVGRLMFMQGIMNATVSGQEFGSGDMAKLLGMDDGTTKMLYTYYIASYGDTSGWGFLFKP